MNLLFINLFLVYLMRLAVAEGMVYAIQTLYHLINLGKQEKQATMIIFARDE
jgi:hypothetical protein